MSFRSPLPDVAIPNLTLFDYLFADIADVADRPAVIDGPSGAQTTYGQLVGQISALAGGLAAARLRRRRRRRHPVPERSGVRDGLPRHPAGRRDGDHDQLAVHRRGDHRAAADSHAGYLFTISAFLPQADLAAASGGAAHEQRRRASTGRIRSHRTGPACGIC